MQAKVSSYNMKIVKWKSYYINDERLKKMFHLKFPWLPYEDLWHGEVTWWEAWTDLITARYAETQRPGSSTRLHHIQTKPRLIF